jgi:hypothetical protein
MVSLQSVHSTKAARLTRKRSLSEKLQEFTSTFKDCFQRISDYPRYSPIRAKRSFEIRDITRFYRFEGKYAGATFCPFETQWRFLDRGIFEHNGYGRGSNSRTVVQSC